MADERESGPRRVLNFGHTLGHALESATGYRRFKHGEAVAYGMLAAAAISASRGLLAQGDERRLAGLIRAIGPLPAVRDLSAAAVVDAVKRDKKIVRGRLHFVLLSGLGRTALADDVTPRELTSSLRRLGLRA
jgi:3-dehydroquinate synthase